MDDKGTLHDQVVNRIKALEDSRDAHQACIIELANENMMMRQWLKIHGFCPDAIEKAEARGECKHTREYRG